VFVAVMVEQAEPVEQRDFPVMTALEWQLTFDIRAQARPHPYCNTRVIRAC
jgi:hypothetical protein